MLLLGHSARDENSEMTDGLVHGVDDGLAERPDLVDIVIEVENPVERLLRRRDVVALRAEHHDRRTDVAKVDGGAVRRLDAPRGQLVADEQLVDDELDFLGIEVDMPAPPALELKVSGRFGVDLGVDVVLLGPQRVGRILVLEILHQPAAVELAAAHVAGQRRQPAAAEQTAGIAHRILAANTRPIRQRRIRQG